MLFDCHRNVCSGHDDVLMAIHHSLEQIMADIDGLTADFQKFAADVTTAVDELKTELTAALAAQGGVPADVQTKMDALDATVQAADAILNPAPATPVVDPAAPTA
jgi:uncharacterized protein YoxC